MKKTTLLAVTALTLTCLGGQTLSAQAATLNKGQLFCNGKQIGFYYGSGCDISTIWDKLGSCFPNISLPDCELPETNLPETEAPEVNLPEINLPETETPDTNIPDSDSSNGSGNDSTEDSLPETILPVNTLLSSRWLSW